MAWSRAPSTWVALGLYSLLAVALFAGTWADPSGSWIGSPKDPQLFIWYLGWIPHELAQGHSPLFTDYLSYPAGVNLMWNTSMLFPAVVLWPVTVLFGPVVAYNTLITAGIALSAWCAFLAATRFLDRPPTCLVAGLVYGFSPALVAQALGHPHVVVALFPPIALILGHEILVRRRMHPAVAGGLAGVAAALQLLTGEELLAMTLMVAAIGVALLALLHRDEVRSRLAASARAAGAALLTFAVIAGYPLGFQFFGPQRVYGDVQQPDVYVSDLVAFAVPSRFIHLTGNTTENGAYLGVPLLALFVAGAIAGRQRTWVRWTAAISVIVAVLSLGPHLHVDGQVTPIPLPWAAVATLPLLGSALPARLMAIAFLGVGLVVAAAIAIAFAASRPWRFAAALMLVAGLAAIAPSLPYPSQRANVPSFFLPGGGVEKIAQGSVVLITPFSSKESTDAMYWQAAANYRFRMPEGDAFTPGPYLGPHPSFLERTLDGMEANQQAVEMTPDVRAATLADIQHFQVATIVAGPSSGLAAIVGFWIDFVGTPPMVDGGVYVWDLPTLH
jgi:hypothetical protein